MLMFILTIFQHSEKSTVIKYLLYLFKESDKLLSVDVYRRDSSLSRTIEKDISRAAKSTGFGVHYYTENGYFN